VARIDPGYIAADPNGPSGTQNLAERTDADPVAASSPITASVHTRVNV